MTFTPLRVRSHGSLLHGVASPEALVHRALERGYGALALTDRDNLYLAIRFYKAARAEGLRPLLGCTLTSGKHEVLLLPLDRCGYANMCRILTQRQIDARFDLTSAVAGESRTTRANRDAVVALIGAEPASLAGLHVIVESPGLAAALLAAGVPAARDASANGRGGGGVWLGLRGLPAESRALGECAKAARRLHVPMVATGDCMLLEPADHDAHRVAVTAAAGELLERMERSAFVSPEARLLGPADWVQRVQRVCMRAGLPDLAEECLRNNAALADRCRLEIDLGVPIFPRAPLSDGETGVAHLRRLCEEGVRRRYGRRTRTALERLGVELETVERMGFTDYFLLVAEIVGFARANDIPTVGRGSGASSLTAYCLGITNVDPIRYGLTFERFLNPTRRDCPDLDIDLCWRRRDDVIDHVYKTYGADHVAMISTHSTLGARSAFRETAKALGVSNKRVNTLAKRIPRDLAPPYRERLEAAPDARFIAWREPPLARALELAERLAGSPRHLSVHCGGIVIGDRPLTYYVPLERAAKSVIVTQFEMRAIEAIGLVKMDLLGNRALSTIGECVRWVRAQDDGDRGAEGADDRGAEGADDRGAEGADDQRAGDSGALSPSGVPSEDAPLDESLPSRRPLDERHIRSECARAAASRRPALAEASARASLDLERVDGDPATADRIAAGDTLNCFQLESPAMRHLLRMLDARSLDDTIAAVALVRPGPAESGMKEAFCRRQRGIEAAKFLHPRLESVLGATHGVMLYEEDVMRVAAALTGLSLAEGDDLRRAIGAARTDEEFRALERGFVTHAARTGIAHDVATEAWRDLTRFGSYAFCKAHAAGYGTLGFQCAYLKHHFPTEFAVGILNHHAGMYATWVHVEDLRRQGVQFRAPCVQRSQWDSTLEVDVPGIANGFSAPGARGRPIADGGPRGLRRVGRLQRGPRSSQELAARQPATNARCFSGAGRERSGSENHAIRTATENRNVRVGLSQVYGLHEDTGERIVNARMTRAFASLVDLIERAAPTLPELEALILAGALDWTECSRPSLLLEARLHGTRKAPVRPRAQSSLTAIDPVSPHVVPALPEFDLAERVRGECRSTGLWFSGHPLDVLLRPGVRAGTTAAAELPRRVGQRLSVSGLPCARRRVETKKGETMSFITIADESGLAECVLFPDAYRTAAAALRGEALRIEGRVDDTLGAITLVVDRVTALPLLATQIFPEREA